jgi:hypothetical protein
MEHSVTQFETRWNRLIVELFGVDEDDEPGDEHERDASERNQNHP